MSSGEDESKASVRRLPAMGRALGHRNFRLFVVGQGISVLGTWMQQIATVWLVFRLSNSSLLLGVADFTAQIPAALILPLAGVLTDRWQRQRTVIATQTLMMIQAFALMALTVTGVVSVWQILVLGAMLGVASAFDSTARQAFVIEMVDGHDDLGNAIAINSSVFNAARLLGPAVAGIMIGLCGEWPCFLLNGLSYLAVLASLLAMRVRPVVRRTADAGIVAGLSEGLGYIAGSMPIRTILVLVGIVSMMSAPLTVLMPLLATQVLHGGPYTLGLLTAALGAGALGGSLFLAARKSVVGLGRVIAAATAAFGLGLAGLSLSHFARRIVGHLAGHRFCHGGPDGGQQRRAANDRRGGETGARDEFLHDGFLRHGAAGELARRRAGRRYRHLTHLPDLRCDLPCRLGRLYGAAAGLAEGHPANVRSGRIAPRRRRGPHHVACPGGA